MPYVVQPIMLYPGTPITTVVAQYGASGFPSSFNYWLYSAWFCLGNDGLSRTPTIAGPINGQTINVTPSQIQLTILAGLFDTAFSGQFNYAWQPYFSNVLISLDAVHQVAQVYVNDTPLTMTSGTGWAGSPRPFLINAAAVWELEAAGAALPGTGAGDVFIAAPASFYDLTIPANRHAFHNIDLTPVDLGVTGSGPLGVQPPVFLTVRPGGTAPNFANNNGFGGAWNSVTTALTFESGITCLAPPGPSGGGGMSLIQGPACTPYNVQIPSPQGAIPTVLLSVSNDGGRTWSLLKKARDLGEVGEYQQRVRWLKMGSFRNRLVKLEITDPVRRNIIGVYQDITPGLG